MASSALPSHGSTHASPETSPKKIPVDDQDLEDVEALPVGALPVPPVDKHHGLHRGLSARQVSMIAIAGTIGTGLFLGTGRSLAQGGPASMLLCYAIVGLIVYITLLLLGGMGTQYPVAGEYTGHKLYSILANKRYRIIQCICYAFLLAFIWLRPFLELLVQRCGVRRL